jgi:hypothetical protein
MGRPGFNQSEIAVLNLSSGIYLKPRLLKLDLIYRQNSHTKSFKMHSGLTRVQNVFGFFTTVCSFIAFFVAASVFFIPQSPSAELALRDIKV